MPKDDALAFLTGAAHDLIALSRHLGDGCPGRNVFIETAADLWDMKRAIIMGNEPKVLLQLDQDHDTIDS